MPAHFSIRPRIVIGKPFVYCSVTRPPLAAQRPNGAPDVARTVVARLALDGEPLGYIEAINPSDQKFHYASELLASLTRFFAILLRNRDMMKRLDRLSKSDQLTGLLERLQAHFEAAKISIALGCTTTATPIDNIDDVLKQADALMYRQKLEQHRQKNEF